MGVENVEYNPGVLEFLKEKDENIKHYILTSGYDEYVMHTEAGKYVEKVYGTSFKYENGELLSKGRLLLLTVSSSTLYKASYKLIFFSFIKADDNDHLNMKMVSFLK